MENEWDVPAVHRGAPDRTPPRRQEAQTLHQIQEQQLVAQVQRNLPFVSKRLVTPVIYSTIVWMIALLGSVST